MAQHDYNLANQSGAAFRADLNSALAAIQSVNSGATEPSSTVAYMPWADTNSGLWKVRNAADSAWVSVMSLTASRVDTAAGTSYDNSSSGLAATNVKDAIDEIVTTGAFEKATTDQAETGTNDTAFMTPLKTAQSIAANVPFASSAENIAGTVEGKAVDPLGIREAFNATGSAPVYACRAWVNFNGTGTVAIRASGNVSSITDNGVGDYRVNFTAAMPDANYSATGSNDVTPGGNNAVSIVRSFFDGSLIVRVQAASGGFVDANTVSVAVFR